LCITVCFEVVNGVHVVPSCLAEGEVFSMTFGAILSQAR
jgi:hypothetical protein